MFTWSGIDGIFDACISFSKGAVDWNLSAKNLHYPHKETWLSKYLNKKALFDGTEGLLEDIGNMSFLQNIHATIMYVPYKRTTRIPRWNDVETVVSASFQRGIHEGTQFSYLHLIL